MMKLKYYFVLLGISLLLPFWALQAQTTLSPGDIVIVAINGDVDAPNSYGRGFSFMPLVNLEAGTVICFTDYGWSDSASSFIANKGIADAFIHYTAPSAIAAGTILRCDSYHTTGFTYDTSYSGSGNNWLNTAGLSQSDELLVFQGTRSAPTFIFAVTYVSTAISATGWATNVGNSGTDGAGSGSALPPGLTNDVTALSFNQPATANDNSSYTGVSTPATKAVWQSRIQNYSNWTFYDSIPIPTPPVGPFSVTDATSAPTVTTTAAGSIATTSATLGGNVTADGGATVDDRGVVYSLTATNANPEVGGTGVTKVAIGSGTGVFSQSIGSLTQNTRYSFRAYAHNSEGYSYGDVDDFYTLATVPPAPTVTNATATTADVNVNSGTNPATTTYAIHINGYAFVKADGTLGDTEVWQDEATWGTKTVSGLMANADNTIVVKARNGDNVETAYSPTATARTLAAVPPAPTVNHATTTTLDVEVSEGTNAPFTNLAIHIKGTPSFVKADGSLGTSEVWQETISWGMAGRITVTGLTPNTDYSFEVKARNADNVESAYSSTGSANTLATVPPAPTVTNATSTTADVNVNAGTNPATTTYAIHINGSKFVKADGTLGDTEVWQDKATWSTITVSGLSPSADNSIEVKARNGNNVQTAYSPTATARTLAAVPPAPTANNATATTINVNVNAGTNPVSTTYAIHLNGTSSFVAADGSLVGSEVWQSDATWGTKTVSGLTPNTNYSFEVKARNADNVESAYSSTGSARTLAAVPPAPTVTNATATTADVNVNAGTNSASTTYAIRINGGKFVKADGTLGDTEVWQDEATWGTITVSGLTPGASASIEVKARNGNNVETTYSGNIMVATLAAVPPAPIVNNATTTTLVVTVSEGANFSTTGLAIHINGTPYFVKADGSLGTTEVWQEKLSWDMMGTITVKGLTPNTNYSFEVKARNEFNVETAYSSIGSARTLAAVPPAPTVNNPTATTIDVDINAGTNPASTTYAIHIKGIADFVNTDGTLNGTEVWQTEAAWGTVTVSGLAPNTSYAFEVKARNADNVGTAYSNEAVANTLARLYVDASKTSGSNSGNNWTDAFTSFQSALDIAIPGCEIWVAKGTYKPSSAYDLTNSSRFYHFRMIEGVAIYGGFAGSESAVSERVNFGENGANETIFSGDLLGNDVVSGAGATLSITSNEENCYHVFYNISGLGLTNSAVLDGCTISGGYSDDGWPNGNGGGMLNDHNAPTIRNTVFKNNFCVGGGAGLFINNSSNPSLLNLTFKYNNGGDGCGGLSVFGLSNITIYNSIFAFNFGNTGGGLENYNSTATFVNATIYGNHATFGGGIANENNGTLNVRNCIIRGNTAETSGNEIYHSGGATNLNYTCYGNQTGDVEGAITLGDGNKTSNPNFVSPGIGDLRICGDSPCADAGDGSYFNDLISLYDIRGNGYSRKLSKTDGGEGTIDMGAYEYKFGSDPAQSVPTVQASNIVQTVQGSTSMTIGLTRGNGTDCAIFMKACVASGSQTPADNTTYMASTNWSAKGTEIGSGWYCIYNGNAANPSIALTNLIPGELYRIEAFEYSGDPSTEKFLKSDGVNNPKTYNTLPDTVWLSNSYSEGEGNNPDNKYWGVRYFNNLSTAVTSSVANSTIHVSNYAHTGALDADANTYIIDNADFVVNGTITATTHNIQAIGHGYLVQSPAQNVGKVYPIGDGTNDFSVAITCSNAPTQPVKMKINHNKQVQGAISTDFWDISGESGLNATIKLRIPKSALSGGAWQGSNQIRIFNGTRYVPVAANRIATTAFAEYVEITITGVNGF